MKLCECFDCWEIRTYHSQDSYPTGCPTIFYGQGNYHANGFSFNSEEEYERYLKIKAFW